MEPKKTSPALKFLRAAVDNAPKSLGVREYVDFIHGVMKLAVQSRFVFGADEGEALKHFNFHSCSGVFRPLDETYYRLACESGGTFPRLWEKAKGIDPWVAQLVVEDQARTWEDPVVRRVCSGTSVLMPYSFKNDGVQDDMLENWQGWPLWRCTSISTEYVVLCRYRVTKERGNQNSKLIKRAKIDRDEWAAAQGQLTAISQAKGRIKAVTVEGS